MLKTRHVTLYFLVRLAHFVWDQSLPLQGYIVRILIENSLRATPQRDLPVARRAWHSCVLACRMTSDEDFDVKIMVAN